MKTQKWLNKYGTIMICYAIVSVFMLITRGWDRFDLALFAVNMINFIAFQFTEIELYQTCLISIAVGVLSIFFLAGLGMIVIGLLLALYSIICMSIYYKK